MQSTVPCGYLITKLYCTWVCSVICVGYVILGQPGFESWDSLVTWLNVNAEATEEFRRIRRCNNHQNLFRVGGLYLWDISFRTWSRPWLLPSTFIQIHHVKNLPFVAM